MTYVITEACIDVNDDSCVAVCPVDCIHVAGRMHVIDPDECIDCGACLPECPVDAIYVDEELPEELSGFLAINATFKEGLERVDNVLEDYLETHPLSPR
ncbi:MAG: ferredoxin family protein [Actinobacteria bacterium]|nr:ferredoxin family protein [Actinomycetota bacterium]